jgi:hypothetical protein
VLSTGTTTATVEGLVNPAGETTQYQVDYGLASSMWCASLGSSGVAEHATSAEVLGTTDGSISHLVTLGLTGLTKGAEYCAEVLATNGSGTGRGGQEFFTAGRPSVFTSEARSTGTTNAIVEGEIDPNEQATQFHVAYGLAGSVWCRTNGTSGPPEHVTPLEALAPIDATFHPVAVNLSGLTQGDEYCVEVLAENGSGTEHGGLEFFTAGAPRAFTLEARSTGTTTASVGGEVNPAGQETHYAVAYGQASSTWCRLGFVGSPEHTTTPEPLGFMDPTFHPVTVTLSGLAPGSEYCAELVAVNGSGTEHGGRVSFTTTAVHSITVSLAGTGAGTVGGSGISCPGTCSLNYPSGTHIVLIATPAAGSTFVGWSGPCAGTGTCSVTLSANRQVTATFAANPPPAPSGGVLGVIQTSGKLSLLGSTITVQANAAAVKLACAGLEACAGRLMLTAKITTKKGKRKHTKTQTIATATFSIPLGKTVIIKLKLNATGRALLSAAHGRLNATLTILTTSPSPRSTQTKSVHLVQQKAKKGKR